MTVAEALEPYLSKLREAYGLVMLAHSQDKYGSVAALGTDAIVLWFSYDMIDSWLATKLIGRQEFDGRIAEAGGWDRTPSFIVSDAAHSIYPLLQVRGASGISGRLTDDEPLNATVARIIAAIQKYGSDLLNGGLPA
jgi:hypothetical protein